RRCWQGTLPMPRDPTSQRLVVGFLVEAKELGERLTLHILELEKEGISDIARSSSFKELARGLHTLKGSAATVGLSDLSEAAHLMEDLLAPVHRALVPLPTIAADVLLRSLDLFIQRLDRYAKGHDASDLPPFKLLDFIKSAIVKIETVVRSLEAGRGRIGDRGAGGLGGGSGIGGEEDDRDVDGGDGDGDDGDGGDGGDGDGDDEEPNDAVDEPSGKVSLAEKEEGSWRVDTRQVSGFIAEVERLRELRLRLDKRHSELERRLAAVARPGALMAMGEVRALLADLRRELADDGLEVVEIVESLEDGLKAICTLPVSTVVDPLHRAVRDLCRVLGREGTLAVVGGEARADRRLLEALRGPLVQLVRNAVDHGIEEPEERERLGKHREGAITIRIEQLGNLLFIEVADDGRGLDAERIREEAQRRELVAPDELASLAKQQLHQLIFLPGFSTRREVTETSGRGVGMHVVANQARALQGRIEVQSTPGQGTRFIMSFPVELGSSPVLLVRCAENQIGLPLLTVAAILSVKDSQIRLGASPQLLYNDELLPLYDLAALLGLRSVRTPVAGMPLLIVTGRGRRIALLVDEVLGESDLVIRPLPAEADTIPAYQGAATLAHGELVLVVRADWLGSVDRGRAQTAQKERAKRVLVVDDSLTARAVQRAMLESFGFTVHAVSSAEIALERLREIRYDVLLCDVGMPGTDGLALVERIRARPETRSMPVLLVTVHDSDADREQGVRAGADGLLSKRECVAERLRAEVDRVMALGARRLM
ncbi:MAG: response regulator, partial [Pseudomonadota bacterium]